MLGMETAPPGTYRRSAGSPRGQARREALLAAVADDLAANGLADFSLRRAARAAGTTHKVLLYHFAGAEELLAEAMRRLRARRIDNVLATAPAGSLAERVAAFWPILADDATGLRVIDQAIGLAMYDPNRYGHLAREASDMYRGPLEALCPPSWSAQRRSEVAELIMAAMRGFLLEWRTAGDAHRIDAARQALTRALEREEAADE